MFPMANTGFFKRGDSPESMLGKTGISFTPNGYFIDVDEFPRLASGANFTILYYVNLNAATQAIVFAQNNNATSDSSRILLTRAGYIQNATSNELSPGSNFRGVWIELVSGTLNLYVVNDSGVISSSTGNSLSAISAPNWNAFMQDIYSQISANADLISFQYEESTFTTIEREDILENFTLLSSPTREYLFYAKTDGESDLGAYPAVMTNYTTPSPYEILFSWEFSSASFPAWSAFDGNLNTRTILRDPTGTVAAGSFLTVDFGVGNTEVIDRMIMRNFSNVNAANSFSVQGSSDNSSWTTLLTTNAALTADVLQYFNITNSTGYRYYRILFNSSHGGTFISLYEIFLINTSKEWATGGGYAKDGSLTFPT